MAAATYVSDITAQAFQKDVVERSMAAPVLLDFWAAWCGPCRTLGPVLEKLAGDYGGAFTLGKVDTEREPDLSYAFGVQGIPFCVLVVDGRPVDAFQGALPEAEVRKFLQRNGIEPLAKAPAAPEPPAVDPQSPEGRLQRGLAAVAAGDVALVRTALEGFPEEDERHERAQRLLGGLEWLEASAPAGALPAAQGLAAARQQFLRRDLDGTFEQLLASVAADKTYQNSLARRAMLLCFAYLGEEDERVDEPRRRLARLLY
ncbi:MAG: tetratricopeptide repeat protein [Planctomycetes bacterium]|nr:tetratricopeptide repeat protein [Planctomycetota bacterium]